MFLFPSSDSGNLFLTRLGRLLQINCIEQLWAFFAYRPFSRGSYGLAHCAGVLNLAFKMEGHMTFHLLGPIPIGDPSSRKFAQDQL